VNITFPLGWFLVLFGFLVCRVGASLKKKKKVESPNLFRNAPTAFESKKKKDIQSAAKELEGRARRMKR